MPEISRFFGIVIRMFYGDHLPAHLHAVYGSAEVLISINPIRVLRGGLPRRALSMVLEWAALHQEELLADWELAARERPLRPIDPLE
jgi:hypothetical protein